MFLGVFGQKKQMTCVMTVLSHLVRLLVLLSDLFVMIEN